MGRKEMGRKEMDRMCSPECRHIWLGLENTTANLRVLKCGLLLGKPRNRSFMYLANIHEYVRVVLREM
jgi:hypothetical protein